MTPAHVRRSLAPTPEALIGVHVLIGDSSDLASMFQEASNEVAPRA